MFCQDYIGYIVSFPLHPIRKYIMSLVPLLVMPTLITWLKHFIGIFFQGTIKVTVNIHMMTGKTFQLN